MHLILMRHAEAAPAPGGLDASRPLTAFGMEQARTFGLFLKEQEFPLSAIEHSPLLRTTQTARLVAESLSRGLEPGVNSELAPGADTFSILGGLRSRAEEGLLYILHAPDVGELSVALLGAPALGFRFAPGAALALHFENGQGRLIWHHSFESYARSLA
ncbi:MAG: histidine phosphatase family protein [Spirochaetales bacterium]|nr:histidine phosphatase family protein [Spirochaetales bacterium]